MKTGIIIQNLQKKFQGNEVFRDFNLAIEPETITALFGPNGAGKSTLLNILAGVVEPDAGSIIQAPCERFAFSYVFQNYRASLLPWRTNFENVTFPLQLQHKSQAEKQQRLDDLQKLLGVQIDWSLHPYELSGGQQQILAFLRALITQPKVLFIDEPFSAVDYENNLRLRGWLQKYYLAYRPTILIVTHNIEEAVHLAHKIVVLSNAPATVIKTIANPQSHPRSPESMQDEIFQQTKNQVLDIFKKVVKV